ncbi:cobyric acid synthase [Pectinatus brassicae]|uniref:Cobyric acid synthase n=1 Tax=Pectinatus brassicae TaxID=862415 RepID=A0A840UT75_9FIRM|nr:cobyric acid synthase [Pectinatus brassicae]MBB5336163.1 adenosylcobyric acid synthase [Pectinatus brassicae]
MTKYIMLQGTSSHVGKSILTTALCRIFFQDGINIAPFKAQNMALNSYVTEDGKEMGRAQIAQAEAAGLTPRVEMNPVLLKPTGNSCSQVVLMGKAVGNMSAKEYHQGYSLKAFDTVKEALGKLQNEFEMLAIEGAGSPAEVNLKDNDIVNMRIAKYLQAPVLLIADIDRGGALASLVGTLELLDDEEKALVKGLIINKFRGDIKLLEPALKFLEEKTGKPVLGVVPYLENLGIDDEDSVSLDDKKMLVNPNAPLKIAVIRTPKISNFTDFDALSREEDVCIYYVSSAEELGAPDIIILPGSKNTTEDLLYLRESGIEDKLRLAHAANIPIIGICGGYQMLGIKICDPYHTESKYDEVDALGFLPMITTFAKEKVTSQVKAQSMDWEFLGETHSFTELNGYEIHMGVTEFTEKVKHPFIINIRNGEEINKIDGASTADGLVLGSYIHGIFDNDDYRRTLLNILRNKKGLPPLAQTENYAAQKQAAFNRLAQTVRNALDMDKLKEIIEQQ